MKNFDDFLKTLTEKDLSDMAKYVNDNRIEVSFPVTNDGVNSFLTGSVAANSLMTIQILRKYHDWLHS